MTHSSHGPRLLSLLFGGGGGMDRDAVLQVIRDCFAHVTVERIVIEYDSLIGGEVAKVVVSDDQLADALRNNGEHARRAAMQSGLDVEVVLASK